MFLFRSFEILFEEFKEKEEKSSKGYCKKKYVFADLLVFMNFVGCWSGFLSSSDDDEAFVDMDLDAIVAASQSQKKEVAKDTKKQRSVFFAVIRFGEMFLVFLGQILFLTMMMNFLQELMSMLSLLHHKEQRKKLEKRQKKNGVCFWSH